MSNETGSSAAERFAHDMRRLREERNVTVETVHDHTQVARPLIETFEEGELHDHAAFNEVYLRSFVRAYAKAIDLPPDVALKALDAALADEYHHEIAAQYLESSSTAFSEQGEEQESSDEESAEPPGGSGNGEAAGETLRTDGAPSPPHSLEADSPEGEAKEVGHRPSHETGVSDSSPEGSAGPPPPVREPVEESAASTKFLRALADRDIGSNRVVLGGGVALLVLVVATGLSYMWATGPSPTDSGPASAPEPDTAAAAAPPADSGSRELAPAAPAHPPADLTLGPTLHLAMKADSNVSRILVQRDDDLRRPYWIRRGEVEVFPFRQRIQVERGLDDVSLYLEGYPFPVAPDSQNAVVITRSRAQAFADTLRGQPVVWGTPPDTNNIGPPPSAPSDSL